MTQEEFKRIFEMHFADVRRYIFYRSGDQEMATDITQDAFLKIWEKQHLIDHSKIRGLLFKISGDIFISRYRKEKRSYEFFKSYAFDQEEYTPEEYYNFNQLKVDYDKALSSMPEKLRTVFLMNRMDGTTYREIAELLGISQKAVEKRMKKALDYLKVMLKQNE